MILIFPKVREETPDSTDTRTVCKDIFDSWGIGDKHCNNGVLIYLATEAHQVYICTGRGALGFPNFLTDSKLQAMIDDVKGGFFKSGDYFGGLQALLVKIRTTIFHEHGAGLTDYNKNPPGFFASIFAAFLQMLRNIAIFACFWAVVGCFGAWQIRKYDNAKDLVDKLQRQRAKALAAGRTAINDSCPICLEDFFEFEGVVDGAGGGQAVWWK